MYTVRFCKIHVLNHMHNETFIVKHFNLTSVLISIVSSIQDRLTHYVCAHLSETGLQCRHSIPAPDFLQYQVVQNPMDSMSKSTSMTNVACESKLRSVVRSSVHPCPGKWVAIRREVVYYVNAFSAGIKCRHCRSLWPYNRALRFPPLLTTVKSRLSRDMVEKGMKTEIQDFQDIYFLLKFFK